MAPLRERILKSGLLFAGVMAVVGYFAGRLFVVAAKGLGVGLVENEGVGIQGPMIFALIGFAIAAAAECVRRDRPKPS